MLGLTCRLQSKISAGHPAFHGGNQQKKNNTPTFPTTLHDRLEKKEIQKWRLVGVTARDYFFFASTHVTWKSLVEINGDSRNSDDRLCLSLDRFWQRRSGVLIKV